MSKRISIALSLCCTTCRLQPYAACNLSLTLAALQPAAAQLAAVQPCNVPLQPAACNRSLVASSLAACSLQPAARSAALAGGLKIQGRECRKVKLY